MKSKLLLPLSLFLAVVCSAATRKVQYVDKDVAGGTGDHLRCLLNGGYPNVGRNDDSMQVMRQIAALHRRVALLEMTDHEFLDKDYRKERSTFADGTTVTIDRDARTFEIKPELKL